MITLLGGGIVFLSSNAWAPLLLYCTQETTFRSCIQTLRFPFPPVSFEVLVGTVVFVFLTSRTSFNQSFLWFLMSTKHVRGSGRSLLFYAEDPIKWDEERCCIAMETGCLLSPASTDMWIFVWMSVGAARTPKFSVNVTQKSHFFCNISWHYDHDL